MMDEPGMKLHESLALLSELGLTEWLSRDIGYSTQVTVNALAGYLLEDREPLDYRPYIESDFIYEYFFHYDWDIDWFALLTGALTDAIELNANSIAIEWNTVDPLTSVSDGEKMIVLFAHEWKYRAREALKKAIG